MTVCLSRSFTSKASTLPEMEVYNIWKWNTACLYWKMVIQGVIHFHMIISGSVGSLGISRIMPSSAVLPRFWLSKTVYSDPRHRRVVPNQPFRPLKDQSRWASKGSDLFRWKVAPLLLLVVAMPAARRSFLFLVVWPGAPNSVLATSKDSSNQMIEAQAQDLRAVCPGLRHALEW